MLTIQVCHTYYLVTLIFGFLVLCFIFVHIVLRVSLPLHWHLLSLQLGTRNGPLSFPLGFLGFIWLFIRRYHLLDEMPRLVRSWLSKMSIEPPWEHAIEKTC